VHADSVFDEPMRGYEAELVRLGLMPDGSAKTVRAQSFMLFLAVMWGLAIIKILVRCRPATGTSSCSSF
jgi:hypothetical protein